MAVGGGSELRPFFLERQEKKKKEKEKKKRWRKKSPVFRAFFALLCFGVEHSSFWVQRGGRFLGRFWTPTRNFGDGL